MRVYMGVMCFCKSLALHRNPTTPHYTYYAEITKPLDPHAKT